MWTATHIGSFETLGRGSLRDRRPDVSSLFDCPREFGVLVSNVDCSHCRSHHRDQHPKTHSPVCADLSRSGSAGVPSDGLQGLLVVLRWSN